MSIPPPIPADSSPQSAMAAYRSYRDSNRKLVLQTYTILGFLSSGTYGRVYKARLKSPPLGSNSGSNPNTPTSTASNENAKDKEKDKGKEKALEENQVFAIKKFKPDKETEVPQTYTGISQSAMREIAVSRTETPDQMSFKNSLTFCLISTSLSFS